MNNIYKVLSDKHFTQILTNNSKKLSIALFVSENCNASKIAKPLFIELSKLYTNYYFLYVSLDNFKQSDNKYTENIEATPTCVLYFDSKQVGSLIGFDKNELVNIIQYIEQQIDESNTKLLHQKIYTLGKLHGLSPFGSPSKEFTVNDPINVIEDEYNKLLSLLKSKLEEQSENKTLVSSHSNTSKHTDVTPVQPPIISTITPVTGTNNDIDIEEKRKEAEKILLIKQNIEANAFANLQQLKQIYKIKKEQEKNNK